MNDFFLSCKYVIPISYESTSSWAFLSFYLTIRVLLILTFPNSDKPRLIPSCDSPGSRLGALHRAAEWVVLRGLAAAGGVEILTFSKFSFFRQVLF